MNRAEMIRRAAPPCHEEGCEEPISLVEMPWRRDDAGEWRLGPVVMVCGAGHRVEVELEDR